jgi:MFS family permease
MTARTRTDLLLLAGFCAFLFFYGLGAFGLIGADEPRYAQVAREMLERHDWITPVLGGQVWLEKPPLYYWQAMLAYSIFGVSDVAARIPSALDATLLVIAVYLFFRKFRRGVEVDAALITASCAGVIGYAHAASMDMGLAASLAIGMLAWWGWRENGSRTLLAIFYLCMAFGMLAKGPVAPFLAAVVIASFAVSTREWRLVLKTLWLPWIVLFCAVSLPWYALVQGRNPQFFREFILEHNLARFSTNLYHHPEPFWYYIPVTAIALLPWIVFVILAFVESVRAWWGERKSVQTEPDLELEFRIFAGGLLFDLAIETPGLHSPRNSRRGSPPRRLFAAAFGARAARFEIIGDLARARRLSTGCAGNGYWFHRDETRPSEGTPDRVRNSDGFHTMCRHRADARQPLPPSHVALRHPYSSRACGCSGIETWNRCHRSEALYAPAGHGARQRRNAQTPSRCLWRLARN